MRLIDIDKAIASMQVVLDENQDKKDSVAYFAFESIITALKQEPTVDAVILPCKVGDKIFKLWPCGKHGKAVAEFEITHIDIDFLPEIEFSFRKPNGTGYYYFFKAEEIGKTVFLTREDAEEALAKMDKNENM